jgi:hypothetical protein
MSAMRIFHCDHCGRLVFFENVQCLNCKHTLAFLPDVAEVGSLEKVDDALFRAEAKEAAGQHYRLCRNYTEQNVCNWAVPAEESNPYCFSCRLTRVIPSLDRQENRELWGALEVAKRRLIYSLMALKLPIVSKVDDAKTGVAFEFLADPADPNAPKVLTGHADGVITVNIAEADDAEREKRRVSMHEPYRTLLGHFRHEIGHYYWDRLIRDGEKLEGFREIFGDERQDYGAALQAYYKNGPPADWQNNFISAYASSHPWEDWAETWAHYLHLTDTLETAGECGLVILPKRQSERAIRPRYSPRLAGFLKFDEVMTDWFAVTYLLNNLSRGLGQKDSYPFVLMDPVIAKLQFVHEICAGDIDTTGSS